MTRSEQHRGSGLARLAGIAGLLILLATAIAAEAQTFQILHNFAGPDGTSPYAGLSMDRAGNFYGTASGGGNIGGACGTWGCGTVFKLKRSGSGWILSPIYTFTGPDGNSPQARVILGPDGNLYGTTNYGGTADAGTVFKLSPPPTTCKSALCPWRETVLYSFQGGMDGEEPQYGDLLFDQQGNIYGTTPYGGSPGSNCYQTCGVVYELTPSNGGWSESVLYRFQGENDGATPYAGLILDSAGDLYGTAVNGGADYDGVVYKLSPSESGWTENVIYTFPYFGQPYGGLISDEAGNLYGVTATTSLEETVVYELTPNDGGWTFNQLYSFPAYVGSVAKLAMDPSGRLYGTILIGGPEVFQLTLSNGQWTQTGFNGGAGDYAYGNVILDASGNIYSTANEGGTHDDGVVFEITP